MQMLGSWCTESQAGLGKQDELSGEKTPENGTPQPNEPVHSDIRPKVWGSGCPAVSARAPIAVPRGTGIVGKFNLPGLLALGL